VCKACARRAAVELTTVNSNATRMSVSAGWGAAVELTKARSNAAPSMRSTIRKYIRTQRPRNKKKYIYFFFTRNTKHATYQIFTTHKNENAKKYLNQIFTKNTRYKKKYLHKHQIKYLHKHPPTENTTLSTM
jgi:hypothetical protein